MRAWQGYVNPERQKGLALLIFVITIVLAVIGYIVSELTMSEIELQKQEKTRAVLKKAKRAVLAYAMNYPDISPLTTQGPGNMPCPDSEDADGRSNTGGGLPVGCLSLGNGTIGRFPWETVQSGELRDGDNELLWYAVSSNYVNVGARILNTSTTGQITMKDKTGAVVVDGADINGIVAVIISPGKAIIRDDGLVQRRATLAEMADPRNYLDIAFAGDVLEEDNADFINGAANGFIHGPQFNAANQVIVNDLIEVITYNDLMELMHARAAEEIMKVIEQYFVLCGAFPDAATFDPIGGAPYDSAGLQEGMLPVGNADPLDWDQDHPPYCDLTGIRFPDWVVAEEWHFYTYYKYAYTNPVFPPGGAGTACTVGVDCITVIDLPVPNDNKQAILMFAGRALGQDLGLAPPLNDQVRHDTDISHYFEAENKDLDNIFDMTPYDNIVPEDYIQVILP